MRRFRHFLDDDFMWGHHHRDLDDTAYAFPPSSSTGNPLPLSDYSEPEAFDWTLPDEVVAVTEQAEEEHDCGVIHTDAQLLSIPEVQLDGKVYQHCLMQLPSEVSNLPDSKEGNTFNIAMMDTSGSMYRDWSNVHNGWNTYVGPYLNGRHAMYRFSSTVRLLRNTPHLEGSDLDQGSTNLTKALTTVLEQVYRCRERYINVFLVTDGNHNMSSPLPNVIIDQMLAPRSKVVQVFVLGVNSNFPVQYSIDIRSRLHNGSNNIPYLFWAKTTHEILECMANIGGCIKSATSQLLHLSVQGKSIPLVDSKSSFHLKEWVYFPYQAEELRRVKVSRGRHSAHLELKPQKATKNDVMTVLGQWNTTIIQMHRRGEKIPDVLPLIDLIFNVAETERPSPTTGSIQARLSRKEETTIVTDFRTLLNNVKTIITKGKFMDELQLAETVLNTTVKGGRYETKVLERKGHTDKEHAKDWEQFFKVYQEHKGAIMAVPANTDDCCRITATSTLQDLQDPHFHELGTLNKFEFMKKFTMSGIGVFAPSHDSVLINPWSFRVRRILREPYGVVSQTAMEDYASVLPVEDANKVVELKADDPNTHFNAVVPVFPPEAAKVVRPLVHTKLYAMCTTFALLKNPHVVDFNVHFAALGVTWVRLLHENPDMAAQPEYVKRCVESIEATAALYIGRPTYSQYWEVLWEDPSQALMTESTRRVEQQTLKCETLIKPMFILHMQQKTRNQHLDQGQLTVLMRLTLLEYVGRCLSNYKLQEPGAKPFVDFFTDAQKNEAAINTVVAGLRGETMGSSFSLKSHYNRETMEKAAKKEALQATKHLKEQLWEQVTIAVNMNKIQQVRNVSGTGDVSWTTMRTFSLRMGLPAPTVEELFSEESVLQYVCHSLLYRASRARLSQPLPDLATSRKIVMDHVRKELSEGLQDLVKEKVLNNCREEWLTAYREAHQDIVVPMNPAEIVMKARERGVDVTEATFSQVYKRYRPDVGLLSNACQCPKCPFYLIPNRSYNQHASVERSIHLAFPHSLHRTAFLHRHEDPSLVLKHVSEGKHSKNHRQLPKESLVPWEDDVVTLQSLYRETAP